MALRGSVKSESAYPKCHRTCSRSTPCKPSSFRTFKPSNLIAGQAPELPRHIRLLLPLLRSRPGGVRSRAIARVPEPVIKHAHKFSGGEGGIRTHGTVSRTQHFQCCQLSRSCTSPDLFMCESAGGEGGIRTHGTLAGTTVFETARFSHSRTSPLLSLFAF